MTLWYLNIYIHFNSLLFLFSAKEKEIKHHELVHAMKQARCLGFEGEPDFVYNPEYGT